jgi:hypothetical protein
LEEEDLAQIMEDAAAVYVRQLLNFIGIRAQNGAARLVLKDGRGTDVDFSRLGGPKLTLADAVKVLEPHYSSECVELCLSATHHWADKSVAHYTKPNPLELDRWKMPWVYVVVAAFAVRKLMLKHVYSDTARIGVEILPPLVRDEEFFRIAPEVETLYRSIGLGDGAPF